MANTTDIKETEETKQAWNRAATKLGINSLIQGVQILSGKGTLVTNERHQLNIMEVVLKELLGYFDERSKMFSEEG